MGFCEEKCRCFPPVVSSRISAVSHRVRPTTTEREWSATNRNDACNGSLRTPRDELARDSQRLNHAAATITHMQKPDDAVYTNGTAPIERRGVDLIDRMTLAEKRNRSATTTASAYRYGPDDDTRQRFPFFTT